MLFATVTYKRPLRTNEPVLDKMIEDKETTVVAAIGLLNKKYEANAHLSSDKTNEDIRIDFGSRGVHQCPSSLYNMGEEPDIKAWPPMHIAGVNTFNVRIGPTGGQRGYSRITGQSTSLFLCGKLLIILCGSAKILVHSNNVICLYRIRSL